MPSRAMPIDGPIRDIIETGRTRLLITGAVILLAFGCIGVRLVDLTVLRPAQEPRLARTAPMERIETERADIVDRNGEILASGLATASLYANPRRVIDPDDAARLVASVLPQADATELAAKLRQDRSFIWLARNLTPREQWEIHRLGIPGLDFQREETRIYPHGRLVSHILGYTDIDNHGIAGVERSYDARLRGERSPIMVTLDIRIQHIMRDALSAAMEKHRAIGGAGVVLDIKSGEILSLISLPDFDPHQAGTASDAQRRNRATLDVYELGSAFKIFTTAMALDSGVVTLRGGYDATKPIRISRHTIRDYHAKRRWLSVPEIFMYSSNIGAAKMAMDVGTERQKKYLKSLGMLSPAPVELPEVGAPLLPERWSPVHSMTVAFGHGIAVSPLQMASGVAAVLNDGIYMPPTLIKRDASADAPAGHRVISKQTSRQMRRLLRLVVEQGTGRRAAATGYLVGGKTGTAEKQAAGRYRRKSLISSFVGAFPINDPKYLVFAVLDEPKGIKETHGFATGGWVAAPVVRRVVERIGPVVGIAPINEESPELQADLAIDLKRKGHTLASF
ncbi:MAG: penicillin-binding protein 2 [Alphaproteobacteria bacterium]|nr:penicillin-binding protein 2 [Alphaproteobacteria bacterium]